MRRHAISCSTQPQQFRGYSAGPAGFPAPIQEQPMSEEILSGEYPRPHQHLRVGGTTTERLCPGYERDPVRISLGAMRRASPMPSRISRTSRRLSWPSKPLHLPPRMEVPGDVAMSLPSKRAHSSSHPIHMTARIGSPWTLPEAPRRVPNAQRSSSAHGGKDGGASHGADASRAE
jgi:hypothetical protein